MSITSPEGSHCSSGSHSQPSPSATVTSPVATTTINPLSTIGFTSAPMIQTPGTNVESPTVVASFQSVLQQAVQQQQQAQQQIENKPVVELMKTASELINSINKPPVTTTFTTLSMQTEKPVVSNSIPLDLQFPTQDLPTTEAPAITTASNPFQSNEQPLNCVTLPQIMSGITMNGTIPTTTTAAPVIASTVVVPLTQQQSPPTTANDVTTIAPGSTPAQVAVSSLTVADCLGQAIIKSEPMPTMNLTMNNNVVLTVPPTVPTTLPNGVTPQAMGLLGGADLQQHQSTIASALSQMSDNELINYINPNCFEGPLL